MYGIKDYHDFAHAMISFQYFYSSSLNIIDSSSIEEFDMILGYINLKLNETNHIKRIMRNENRQIY